MRSSSSRVLGSIQCTSSKSTSTGPPAASPSSWRSSAAKVRSRLRCGREVGGRHSGRRAAATAARPGGRTSSVGWRGRRQQRLQLGEPHLGRVVAREAGGALELRDHRVERAVLVVRRAEVAQARRAARSRGAPAGPRAAATCRSRPRPTAGRPGPRRPSPAPSAAAAGPAPPRARPAGSAPGRRGAPRSGSRPRRRRGPGRPAPARRSPWPRPRPGRRTRTGRRQGGACASAITTLSGLGQGLQPGGQVRGLADDRLLAGRAAAQEVADHHEPGRDPDADAERGSPPAPRGRAPPPRARARRGPPARRRPHAPAASRNRPARRRPCTWRRSRRTAPLSLRRRRGRRRSAPAGPRDQAGSSSAVEPTRSANITVSCRRSASGVAAAPPARPRRSAAPIGPQYRRGGQVPDRLQQQLARCPSGSAELAQVRVGQLGQGLGRRSRRRGTPARSAPAPARAAKPRRPPPSSPSGARLHRRSLSQATPGRHDRWLGRECRRALPFRRAQRPVDAPRAETRRSGRPGSLVTRQRCGVLEVGPVQGGAPQARHGHPGEGSPSRMVDGTAQGLGARPRKKGGIRRKDGRGAPDRIG